MAGIELIFACVVAKMGKEQLMNPLNIYATLLCAGGHESRRKTAFPDSERCQDDRGWGSETDCKGLCYPVQTHCEWYIKQINKIY